jgi:electron transport complex protein RnfB
MDTATDLVACIDGLLPQTQCARCGYAGCHPYAIAIANGDAAINQCPPGGSGTIEALAALLQREILPLDPRHGDLPPPQVAWIDESRCIGCARCLPACPVDAIVGAANFMHTVVAARCTGCELCIAPCPVDCIDLRPAPPSALNQPDQNRTRHRAHVARLERRADERQRELAAKKASLALRTAPRDPGAPRGPGAPLHPAAPPDEA